MKNEQISKPGARTREIKTRTVLHVLLNKLV